MSKKLDSFESCPVPSICPAPPSDDALADEEEFDEFEFGRVVLTIW
mgnify:CR=1 FL=1